MVQITNRECSPFCRSGDRHQLHGCQLNHESDEFYGYERGIRVIRGLPVGGSGTCETGERDFRASGACLGGSRLRPSRAG